MIAAGSCADVGGEPIVTEAECGAAAFNVGLFDLDLQDLWASESTRCSSTSSSDRTACVHPTPSYSGSIRPEGCYYKATNDADEKLWLNPSANAIGNGADSARHSLCALSGGNNDECVADDYTCEDEGAETVSICAPNGLFLNGVEIKAGEAGTNGTNGVAGVAGAAGANGTNGVAGAAGANGTNGVAGGEGPKGDTGPQGVQGPVGALPQELKDAIALLAQAQQTINQLATTNAALTTTNAALTGKLLTCKEGGGGRRGAREL